MRFLKNKIAQAKAFADKKKKQKNFAKGSSTSPTPSTRKRIPGFSLIPIASRETKNIVKNYGKAICTFSSSSIALPYILTLCQKEEVDCNHFISFIRNAKTKIGGLHHFRSLLLSNENDSKETSIYKKIFREVSEIFVKYFSVNWIFHSKILYKEAHLKFRFKMLRRIRSPEFFTYLLKKETKNYS